MWGRLAELIRMLDADPAIRCILLTGYPDAPEVEEVPASEADTAEGDVLGRLLNWWRNLRF